MWQAALGVVGGALGAMGARKNQKAKNKLIEKMVMDPESRKYDETVTRNMDPGVREMIEGGYGGGVRGAEEAHAGRGRGGGGRGRGRGGQPQGPTYAQEWGQQGVNNMQGAANAAASRTGRSNFAGTNQYLDAAGQRLLGMNPFGMMDMMTNYIQAGEPSPAPRPSGGGSSGGNSRPAGDANFDSGEWARPGQGNGRAINQATGRPLWGEGSGRDGGGAAQGGKTNPWGVEYGGPEPGSFQLRDFQGGPEWGGVDSQGGSLEDPSNMRGAMETLMQRGTGNVMDDPLMQQRMAQMGEDSDRESALKMRTLKSRQGQRNTGMGALESALSNAEGTRARLRAQNEAAMARQGQLEQLALAAGGQLSQRDLAAMQNQSDLYKADLSSATQRYGTDASLAGQVYGTQVGADTSAYGTDVGAATQRYGTDVGAWTQKAASEEAANAARAGAAASAAAAERAARMQQETAMRGQDLQAMAGMMGYQGQMFGNLMGLGNTLETSNLANAQAMGQMGQGIGNLGLGFHQADQGLAGQQAMANAQRASANAAANASMYGSRLGYDANTMGLLAGNTGSTNTQGTKALADYYGDVAGNYGSPSAAAMQGGMQGFMGGMGLGGGGGIMGLFSDERLKSNITYSGMHVAGVPFASWTWNLTGREDHGVIAQDVEKVYPELVTEVGGYKTVDYRGLLKKESE